MKTLFLGHRCISLLNEEFLVFRAESTGLSVTGLGSSHLEGPHPLSNALKACLFS